MRRIPVLFAVLALLLSATPALAVPGCGEGFDLLSESNTLGRIDPRIYTAAEWEQIEDLVASVDANDDDMLCSKQFKPNQGQDKKWIGPEDGAISDYVVTMITDNKSNGHAE